MKLIINIYAHLLNAWDYLRHRKTLDYDDGATPSGLMIFY